MKKIRFIVVALVVLACFIPGQVNTAAAVGIGADFCSMTWHMYWPSTETLPSIPVPFTVYPGPTGWVILRGGIPEGAIPLAPAPAQHEDGRLNYRICRAPLAVYLNEDGGVEVWSTDEEDMFSPLALVATATADEIAAALAEAEATGKDVVISGYVDGFALIATMNGTLKAELIGVYGFEFMPDGTTINGWGNGFEPYDPPAPPPV